MGHQTLSCELTWHTVLYDRSGIILFQTYTYETFGSERIEFPCPCLPRNAQIDSASCLEDKSICDEHAQCVPGEGGHYVCSCDYNYVGDGRSCRPVYEDQSDKLLIARGMAIFERGTSPDIPGKQAILVLKKIFKIQNSAHRHSEPHTSWNWL